MNDAGGPGDCAVIARDCSRCDCQPVALAAIEGSVPTARVVRQDSDPRAFNRSSRDLIVEEKQ